MLEKYPEELRYSDSHLWVEVVDDGSAAIIGITAYINDKLDLITNIELPELDAEVDANEEVGLIESNEDSFDLYSPVSGKIIAINDDLENAPGLINSDPYGDGWIYKIKLIDPEEVEELMVVDDYQEFISTLGED